VDPPPAPAPTPAPAEPDAPVSAQAPEPSRPSSRALDQAPHLAQESAIAAAESALAQVSHQISSRPSRELRARPHEIPSDAEFNGELLRQVREGRGMSVQQLADRTRISSRHIENVEADRYDALPATVYLRGMLMSMARELGIDSLRVSKSYLDLVARQLGTPR
jgi:ribosome-binding protein aMBF1 (putative translation factor)